MTGLNFHFVAQMSMERLLNCVGEGIVIALFAWLLLRVIGRCNSGTRFAVWFCALVAIALAPFLGSGAHEATPALAATAILHPVAAIVMPRGWSAYLFAAWAAIALIGLARVVAGLWHLHTIRQACVPFEAWKQPEEAAFRGPSPERAIEDGMVTASLKRCPDTNREPFGDGLNMDPAIASALEETRGGVELCVSDTLRVPTAMGLVKPAVVIPSWALRELSPDELNAVVLHELAHLRRWDDWTNLAQKVLRALFFFHPAVWWVESRLSLEREMACDDMVLARTANPRAYAECLVSLAEKNLLQRGVALAQAAVGRVRQTSLRVLQILDAQRTHAIGVWKPAPYVVAGFSILCLISAAHAPRLVAFGDPTIANRTPFSAGATAEQADDGLTSSAPLVPASYLAQGHGRELLNGKAPATHRAAAHYRQVLRSTARTEQATFTTKADGSVMTQTTGSVYQAKHREEHPVGAGQLLRTASPERIPLVVVQQAEFVFMQDQPADAGPVLWHVTVWRFTVVPQAPAQVTAATSSQSI